MIKGCGIPEHLRKCRGRRCIPAYNVLIERFGTPEETAEILNPAHIPFAYVFIKRSPVLKSLVHICDRRGIPVADVAIGGGGIRFVAKPHVYSGHEITII